MKLSEALFDEIVASLRLAPSLPPKESRDLDLRSDPRVWLAGRVTIIPCAPHRGRKADVAFMRDLSRGGVGLLTLTTLGRGEQFILYLPPSAGHATWGILCIARHCRPDTGGLANIGAAFERILEPDGIHAHHATHLARPPLDVHPANRRYAEQP